MLEIKDVQLRLGMDENTVTQKLRGKNFGVQEPPELSDRGGKTWLLCEFPDDKDCDPANRSLTAPLYADPRTKFHDGCRNQALAFIEQPRTNTLMMMSAIGIFAN